MRSNRCPFCLKTFTFADRWRFTRWLCFRKRAACPDCGTILINNTWPWRLLHLGVFIILIFVWPLMLKREDLLSPDSNILILISGLALIFIGAITSRYLIIKKPYHIQ